MWRHKTDRRLIAAGLLIVALIIGYNAWKDIQPRPRAPQSSTMTAYTLITRDQEVADAKKDNRFSAIFWAGDIAGDPAVVTPSPVTPTGLNQQASMPLFTLEQIPVQLSPLYKQIKGAAEPWLHGSLVNDIYIDYRDSTPDYDALGPFVAGLRAHFETEYWVVVQLRRTPLSYAQETRTKLANMLKAVEFFVYRLDEVTAKDETLIQTISRLDEEGVPFMLRAAKTPDYAALAKEMPEGKQYFGGFIIDAAQPETQEKTK